MNHDKNGLAAAVGSPTSQEEKKGPHPVNREALKRLINIEGQIRGIERMVENEKYCVDILTQISAVRSALKRVGMLILKRHIKNCVSDAIRKGGTDGDEIIDELMPTILKEEI